MPVYTILNHLYLSNPKSIHYPSASPSFTQDDTSDSFIPEPTQPIPTYTQPAFSQPAFSQPNQSFFSQPAVHFTQPSQTNPNNVQSQQFQQFQTATISVQQGKISLSRESIVSDKAQSKEVGKDAKRKYNRFIHLSLLDEAFKARFGGNEESKKMRKTMLKQQFTEFSVTEEEGLHKGYDRFQKILSQLNQVQARPDNDDINLKFLRALPSSWSQVGLALKTRVVKAAVAPTHSAFIGTTCSGSKPTYSDQQHIVPSVSQTSGRSDNLMECVLHSFVAENDQDQDMIYEDFDQVDQLEMEEMDLKWQMAMLSLRINRFEKKAGRKMNYNNQQPARFDRRKLGVTNVFNLDILLRECNVKTVDEKQVILPLRKTRLMRLEKVYGMMAGLHADNGGAGIFNAADIPPSITGYLYALPTHKSDIAKTQSSDSATYASCGSSLRPRPKDFPPAVISRLWPESYVEDPNSTTLASKFFLFVDEKVKSPGLFVIKDGMNNMNCVKTIIVRVKKCIWFLLVVGFIPHHYCGGSDPAASRNRPHTNSADRNHINPAGWSKRPAPVSAGRPVSAGWLNPAARPYFRPSSVYFNNMYWPNLYDPMYMNKGRWGTAGDPSTDNDIGIVDSGCSRSMTGNKEKLDDFVQVKGGIVKFGGGDGRISGKGTIRTSKLDFENVYYVEELQHFNLFSVSQICDKKNKVLFTDTDCLVLTEDFQLPNESQVVLRIPRKCDLYTFSISELQPEQNVTCLVAKASLDESTRWHRRMAHVNFKTINKLAKEGLVDGLPLKVFTNEHNCVACNKGKQHKASYKHISAVRLITEPLQMLHMDLFGPTNIRSIDQKYYSLVVTDDFSRFTWTFYLGTKDETFYVLKEFIALIENQLNKKVKGIRCDNGTEFKNAKLIELCGEKGIKRDYSNPRTPQQNGVAERKNRTLIEAARTMLADSKLPTMFWTEAVSTACYVLNRVSITNPHNKTPYELISGKGKADDGYLVGYASNSKRPIGYTLSKTDTPCRFAGLSSRNGPSIMERNADYAEELAKLQRQEYEAKDAAARYGYLFSQATAEILCQAEAEVRNQGVSAVKDPAGVDSAVKDPLGVDRLSTGRPSAIVILAEVILLIALPCCATLTNLAPAVEVNPIPTKRVNTIHPQSQILGDLASPDQSYRPTSLSVHNTLLSFLSSFIFKPTSISQNALEDPDWVDAMQEEMQQFINQQVWKLVPLPAGKHAIGTKWILKNKRDARGIVVRNKARLVAQGHRQEEGIDYDELDVKSPFSMRNEDEVVVKGSVWNFIKHLDLVYVDTSSFGSTNKACVMEFELSRPDTDVNALVLVPDIKYFPLTSHRNAVKKIFKYLKAQPKIRLGYPKDYSPFLWKLHSDSDYAGSHGDRKSTYKGWIIHTLDDNVADLLTKAFNGPRFAYLSNLLLVVIPPAASLVSAGSSMVLLVVIFPAARLDSAVCTIFLLVVIVPAGTNGFLLLVWSKSAGSYSSCWTNGFLLVGSKVSAVSLSSAHWSAGWSMLVVLVPAARLVSAGCNYGLLKLFRSCLILCSMLVAMAYVLVDSFLLDRFSILLST
ncbi:putative ribonuclease H-like domain-containing protein [Tanacetum coccineum]